MNGALLTIARLVALALDDATVLIVDHARLVGLPLLDDLPLLIGLSLLIRLSLLVRLVLNQAAVLVVDGSLLNRLAGHDPAAVVDDPLATLDQLLTSLEQSALADAGRLALLDDLALLKRLPLLEPLPLERLPGLIVRVHPDGVDLGVLADLPVDVRLARVRRIGLGGAGH